MAPLIKKELGDTFPAAYEPANVEKHWDAWWNQQGYFTPSLAHARHAADDSKFVMVIPPPNVTGTLHLGHTLTVAIEDTLTRWHRMRGRSVLWLPGSDHAGIATQAVVAKYLRSQGILPEEIGRDEFVKHTRKWAEQKSEIMYGQLRSLGASVDWTREKFTLSESMTHAVEEAFIRLFEAGLIYRSTRLVSWSPFLKTALSDVEVDPEEITSPQKIKIPGFEHNVEVGMLWHFSYKLKKKGDNGEDRTVTVATTRLETMLGDVAVAVHPEDERYKDLVGEELIHPFDDNRMMKIISDRYVDRDFGTGAVKITPAHDKNDYEIGTRHNLPNISILTVDGKINNLGGEFAGQHRFTARIEVEKRLREMGLMGEKTPIQKKMLLPRCSRCKDIVEYMLLPQWFVNCQPLARKAAEVVRSGEMKIIPSFYEATWFQWLDNIRDWCISRQLWWGHQIPAYKVTSQHTQAGEVWVAASTEQEAIEKAKARTGAEVVTVERDADVLDTWFSSALFPFSTMGWPNNTEDLEAFFPGTLLETGHDILFFWVARMVMMSQYIMGKIPFKNVYLHAMVRDAHGRKMSKSLGNVIDPVDVIKGITLEALHAKLKDGMLPEKEVNLAIAGQKKDFPKGIPECGADALRYGLLAYTKQGRNINLDVQRVVGYRFFCNKLWNAVKFALINFNHIDNYSFGGVSACLQQATWMDKWVLHRLNECSKLTNEAFEQYNFGEAVSSTYSFWLYEFCDIYIEAFKERLASVKDNPNGRQSLASLLDVLYICLDKGLRLLHPMLPFVTEELYQRLPPSVSKCESICIAPYPMHIVQWDAKTTDVEMAGIMLIAKQFRSLCSELGLTTERPHAIVRPTEKLGCSVAFLREQSCILSSLAKMGPIEVLDMGANSPEKHVRGVMSDKGEVYLDPSKLPDLSKTLLKVEKSLVSCKKALEGYQQKVDDPNYDTRVPDQVKQQNKEKMSELSQEIESLSNSSKDLADILGPEKVEQVSNALAEEQAKEKAKEKAKEEAAKAKKKAKGTKPTEPI